MENQILWFREGATLQVRNREGEGERVREREGESARNNVFFFCREGVGELRCVVYPKIFTSMIQLKVGLPRGSQQCP